jgi:antitoxin MazE
MPEDDRMHSTIRKWGNSLALRLPRHVAEEARLEEGTTVDLEAKDGVLKVTPARRRFKLADLLEGEPKRAPNAAPTEVDWGEPAGDEDW